MRKIERDEDQLLKKRLLGCYKAWRALDIDKIAPFYSKPGVVIFNDVEPAKALSWGEFRQAESEIMARMKGWKLTPIDVRASVWGKVGLTTATPTLTGDAKAGTHYDATIRHTAVWNRVGRRWLIVHEHWSFPLPSSRNPAKS